MAQLGLTTASKNIWDFDPRTIGSCVLWLDAADSNTISFSSGSNVSTWTDKSAQGNTATTAASGFVSTVAPTYTASNKYVNFGGSSAMTTALTASTTTEAAFVVGSVTSLASNTFLGGTVSAGFSTGGRQFRVSSGGTYGTLTYNNGGVASYANIAMVSPFGANVIGLLEYTINAGAPTLYEYGSSLGTGTTATLTASRVTVIGARGAATSYTEALTGNIYEIIVYNSDLSTSQRQAVEGYLAWKWGLQGNLPATHPFLSGIYSSNPLSSFLPTSISGCVLWLDASDSSTVFSDISGTTPATNGGTVAYWKDKSTSGYNATQSNASNRPTWSSNGMTASSTTISLTTSYTAVPSAESAFVVVTPTSGAATNLLYTTTSGGRSFFMNGLTLQLNKQLTGAVFQSSSIFTYGIKTLVGSVYTGSSATGYNNGTSVATGSSNVPFSGSGTTGIGTSNWNGIIYEIVVFNSALSTTQRQQVEGYLAWKWGTQADLNATNTYIPSFQPIVRPFARQFRPIDIPGCSLWMDAADVSSVTLSGSNVTSIADKSGSALTMTATGTLPYSTNAQNGLNAIGDFSTSAYLSTSTTNFDFGTGDFAIFAVAKTGSTAGGLYPIINKNLGFGTGAPTSNYWFLWRNNSSPAAFQFSYVTSGSNTVTATTAFTVATSTWYVISSTAIRSGVSTALFNGGNTGTTPNGNATTINPGSIAIRIGASTLGSSPLSWGSLIGEVIVYNGTLTAAQRQQVEGYLEWKWGLRNSFASTYPFYNIPTNTQTPFNPRLISGCVLWLDAGDSNTVQLSSGTSVYRWVDKSGNSDDGIQTTAASQPTYSNKAIVFNGSSSQYMTLASPSTLPNGATPKGTYFFVTKLTSGSAVQAFFMYGPTTLATGANPQFYYNSSNQLVLDTFGAGGTTDGTAVLNSTVLFSSTISNTGGTGTVTGWRNSNLFGPTTYTTASITSQKGFIGVTQTGAGTTGTNAYYFTGNVYEIVIYNSVLTTSQRQQVEGYLAWKWGLNSSLPSTHSFIKVSP
jgi:hypothetical protein